MSLETLAPRMPAWPIAKNGMAETNSKSRPNGTASGAAATSERRTGGTASIAAVTTATMTTSAVSWFGMRTTWPPTIKSSA